MNDISNCMDCRYHQVQPDPDPTDWFEDDDEKVVCTKNGLEITEACRPYNKRKECSVPIWCPLKDKKVIIDKKEK